MTSRTICQEEIRTENRRKKLQEWWNDPEYKRRSTAFLEGAVCMVCGNQATVVHHISHLAYRSREEYFDLAKWGVPLCGRCHRAAHKGVPAPKRSKAEREEASRKKIQARKRKREYESRRRRELKRKKK